MIVNDCLNDTMGPEFEQRLHQEPQVWCEIGLRLFWVLKLQKTANRTPSKQ